MPVEMNSWIIDSIAAAQRSTELYGLEYLLGGDSAGHESVAF